MAKRVVTFGAHVAIQEHSQRLTIREATSDDIPGILALLDACVARMRADGIEQWDEIYPTEAVFRSDIDQRSMFVGLTAAGIGGIIVLNDRQDPQYAGVPWTIHASRIGVIHRLMVDPSLQGRGYAREFMLFIEQHARGIGYDALRLDAFTENPAALRLYRGLDYRDAGSMNLRKGPFRGFEKSLR